MLNERPLKVGVFVFPEDSPEIGGGFSYVSCLISAIDDYDFDGRLEVVFVSDVVLKGPFKKKVILLKRIQKESAKGCIIKMIRKVFRTNYVTNLFNRAFLNKIIARLEQNYLERQIKENNIDIIFYPKPGVYIKNYPYVVTNWDIGHRTLSPLPEVAMDGIFESRESYYLNEVRKAMLVIAESEQGKKELIDYYGIPEVRIKVLPMFAGSIVNLGLSESEMDQIFNDTGIDSPFFVYPAQFWPHKNHYNLIRAFVSVTRKFPKFKLVLTGSDKGNLDYIMGVINEYDLTGHVLYLGFISNKMLYTLYKKATALVMPTLLGPTNMPLLEAMALGCPVICSDLPGHRELMGNDCFYFDPLSPEDITAKIVSCISQIQINQPLPSRDKKKDITPKIGILENAFLEILPIRRLFL